MRKKKKLEDRIPDNIFDIIDLRQLYAAAIKKMLPRRHWSHVGDLEYCYKGKKVHHEYDYKENHPVIDDFHKGFIGYNPSNANKRFDPVVDSIILFQKALNRPNCKCSIKRRRFSRIEYEFRIYLKRNFGHVGGPRGVRLFTSTIRREFLKKKKKSNHCEGNRNASGD